MDLLRKIAESRIREALENGELDDLPNRGKPVELEDLSQVPDDLRVGYMVLRNAGILPEEMQLRKDMLSLERMIDCCVEDEEIAGLRKRMNETAIRYRVLRERRLHGPSFVNYGNKVRKRLGV